MRAKAAAGEPVDGGAAPFDLAAMLACGKGLTVRAAVLRHLLIGNEWPVDAKGVWLRGIWIIGELDLHAATLCGPLMLDSCCLNAENPVCLDHTIASVISLTGCQVAGLSGDGLTVRHLDLSDSTFSRTVRLVGADIKGQFNCRGAKLDGRDNGGRALDAYGIKVGGDVRLDGVVTADGAVRLVGADIRGQLNCRGAKLNGCDNDGDVLDADRVKAAGNVWLDGVVTVDGAVRLAGADIKGQLSCGGAKLNGHDQNGDALVAYGMKTGASVLLNEFSTDGTIRLGGAHIGRQLICSGAKLTGDGKAMVADSMTTGGDVFLDEEFIALGTISLEAVHVGGLLSLEPTALAGENKVALAAAEAHIADTLHWAPVAQVRGQVSLKGAAVSQLDDDWSSGRSSGCWPPPGRLLMDGFTYGSFGGDHQPTVDQRLDWIRSQYQGESPATFATQPYEQLAAVYRQAGQESRARKVAIARRADLRKYGKLGPYRRFGNWFLDWSIKYGYESWRAGVGLAAVFAIFWILSILAQQHQLIVWAGDIPGLQSVPSATRCTISYPCFYPFGYTLDTVIPLINVHQADFWGPDGSTPWGEAFVIATWVATVLGWALSTLLVAGYTGLVRQD